MSENTPPDFKVLVLSDSKLYIIDVQYVINTTNI